MVASRVDGIQDSLMKLKTGVASLQKKVDGGGTRLESVVMKDHYSSDYAVLERMSEGSQ